MKQINDRDFQTIKLFLILGALTLLVVLAFQWAIFTPDTGLVDMAVKH